MRVIHTCLTLAICLYYLSYGWCTSWSDTRVFVWWNNKVVSTSCANTSGRNVFSCLACWLYTGFVCGISDLICWASCTNPVSWNLFVIGTCWSDTGILIRWDGCKIGTSCTNTSSWDIFSAWTRGLINTNFACWISDLICWAIRTNS